MDETGLLASLEPRNVALWSSIWLNVMFVDEMFEKTEFTLSETVPRKPLGGPAPPWVSMNTFKHSGACLLVRYYRFSTDTVYLRKILRNCDVKSKVIFAYV